MYMVGLGSWADERNNLSPARIPAKNACFSRKLLKKGSFQFPVAAFFIYIYLWIQSVIK